MPTIEVSPEGWNIPVCTYGLLACSSSRRPLEPYLTAAPLCFSIMRKSASLDFWTRFYIQKIERLMLKHMDTSSKKGSNGRRSIENTWTLPAKSERESSRPIRTGHAKEALHMPYVLSMISGHFFNSKIVKFNFKKLLVAKGWLCERESSRPSNRPIGMGRAKDALHMPYALSMIFGHLFNSKIVKFNFKKLFGHFQQPVNKARARYYGWGWRQFQQIG